MGGERHAPAALPPGKTRYQLHRRVGGPQDRSGRVRKISPPPGFNPRIVQSVVSRPTALSRATVLRRWAEKKQLHFRRWYRQHVWVLFEKKSLLNRAEPPYCLRIYVNRIRYDAMLSGRQVLAFRKSKEAESSSARGQRRYCPPAVRS